MALLMLPNAASAEPSRDAQDPFFGPDKALHFGVSMGLSAGGYALSSLVWDKPWQRAVGGAALSLLAGVGKELWDLAGHGTPSWKDLAWDGMGTAVGIGGALAVDVLILPEPRAESPRAQAIIKLRF